MTKRLLAMAVAALLCCAASAQNRWTIQPDGKTIRMEVSEGKYPHHDHIEMSGKMMATVLYWGIDENQKCAVMPVEEIPGCVTATCRSGYSFCNAKSA